MLSKNFFLEAGASLILVFLQLNIVTGLHFDKSVLKSQSILYGAVSTSFEVENAKNESSLCWRQLQEWRQALEEQKIWALRVLDASGTPRSGFLYGNNYWIGDRAICKDLPNTKALEINHDKIKHLSTPFDYPPYPLEFAVAYLSHDNIVQLHSGVPLDNTITLGLCLPNSCKSDEVSQLLQNYFNESLLEFQKLHDLELKVENVRILKLDFKTNFLEIMSWPKTIFFIIMFFGTLFLVILGTIVDVRQRHRQKNILLAHNLMKSGNGIGKATNSTLELMNSLETIPETVKESLGVKLLQCFSFYSNTKSLFKTTLPSDSIKSLHGLRFFSMIWVIAVHAIFYSVDFVDNVAYGYRLSEDFLGQTFSNSTYCVDTYLCISGFLVAYLFLKAIRNQSPPQNNSPGNHLRKLQEFGLMLLNRIMRLSPPYLMLILMADALYAIHRQLFTLVPTEKPDIMCDKYWWRNVLYINNLFPRSEMCLSWSWYLSIDTQGFILSTFILILSTIHFKTAAGLIITGVLINIVAGTYTSYSIGYIPTMDNQLAFLDKLYDLPWLRSGPYFIGVIAGYILKVRLQDKLVLKKRTRILLWIIFPLINIWIVFTLYTRQLSVGYSAFYMGVSRTLWGVGIAWILIACATGNARLLEKFLSFKGFVPLSRLTYSAYLLNPLIMNLYYMSGENVYHASISNFGLYCTAITFSTFALAYFYSMIFESPFILITKMAFNRILKDKKEANEQQDNQNNENNQQN